VGDQLAPQGHYLHRDSINTGETQTDIYASSGRTYDQVFEQSKTFHALDVAATVVTLSTLMNETKYSGNCISLVYFQPRVPKSTSYIQTSNSFVLWTNDALERSKIIEVEALNFLQTIEKSRGGNKGGCQGYEPSPADSDAMATASSSALV
jgi:hypothetical protein